MYQLVKTFPPLASSRGAFPRRVKRRRHSYLDSSTYNGEDRVMYKEVAMR